MVASSRVAGLARSARRSSPGRCTLAVLLLLAALLVPACAELATRPTAASVAAEAYARLSSTQRMTYNLAVCTMIHNERPYLVEWVLYHYLLGFQHFFLYDNESTDSPAEVLQPFIDRGLVTLTSWPGKARQRQQIDDCFRRGRTDAKWMACFDVDEFVVVLGQQPGEASALQHALTLFEGDRLGAMLLDRMDFDSNGHAEPPAGSLLAAYDSRTVSAVVAPVIGKLLVLLKAMDHMLGAHDVELLGPQFGLWEKATADRERFAEALPLTHHRYEPIRINHYVARSYSECVAKLTLNRWEGAMDWRKTNGQAMCDRNMAGQGGYIPEQHTRDTALSGSAFPDVVGELKRLVAANCSCQLS